MPCVMRMTSLRLCSRSLGLTLALACVALVAGCGNGFKLTGVNVSIVGFKPAPSSKPETTAVMTLRYTSENVIPIGLSGSNHKLYLNGVYVGKTQSEEQPLGLAPLSAINQDVTVKFENLARLQELVAAAGQNTAAYKIDSVLLVTSGEEKLDIKTSGTGNVDLRPLAPAAR
jgi:LEA14-like dessication related protein